MTFHIDTRIQSSCIEIASWPLSVLLLKNESRFPWFILVPEVEQVELFQLEQAQSTQLMQEINRICQWIQNQYQPDKINVASLGNIVSQFHIHVVGRFKHDSYWPHSIWQPDYVEQPYTQEELAAMMNLLKQDNLMEKI